MKSNVSKVNDNVNNQNLKTEDLKMKMDTLDYSTTTLKADVTELTTKIYNIKTSGFEHSNELSGVKSKIKGKVIFIRLFNIHLAVFFSVERRSSPIYSQIHIFYCQGSPKNYVDKILTHLITYLPTPGLHFEGFLYCYKVRFACFDISPTPSYLIFQHIFLMTPQDGRAECASVYLCT